MPLNCLFQNISKILNFIKYINFILEALEQVYLDNQSAFSTLHNACSPITLKYLLSLLTPTIQTPHSLLSPPQQQTTKTATTLDTTITNTISVINNNNDNFIVPQNFILRDKQR